VQRSINLPEGKTLNNKVLKSGVAMAMLMAFVPHSALVSVSALAQQDTTGQTQQQQQSGEAPAPAASQAEQEAENAKQQRAERKKEKRRKKEAREEQAKEAQSGEAPAPAVDSGAAAATEQDAANARKERAERKKEERRKKKEAQQEQPVQSQSEANTSQPSGTATMTADEARTETDAPVTVSKDAVKPRKVLTQPIEQQVQEAEQRPTTIVPDQITDDQRKRLRAADKKRRAEARRDRDRLLGAAAAGAVIGATIAALGGRVAADEGDRLIIERDGRLFVRKDESGLLRDRDTEVEYETLRGGYTREIITRSNGVQIISVRDPGGNVVKRVRIGRNGDRRVLFSSGDEDRGNRRARRDLPRYDVDIPRDRYIVSARRANRRLFRETFAADPVYMSEERYSLAEIRENEPIRSLMRRVDLDTINFDSGSAYASASQVRLLGDIAGGMLDIIEDEPKTIFMIEGHTDATGPEIGNLVLSDRRAESVARILIEAYGIPAENLVTQGYGERFLKVNTEEDERANRRVTIRNITPILQATAD
jgi:outer membrane protein OmpA-like peptidoglycan-associated protein